MERRKYYELATNTLTFFTLLSISFLAFSRKSKRAIHERDNWQCVVCGREDCLEAAHIDHNRDNPRYDDPSNGRTLCTEDHLKDHVLRHGRNGLTKKQNLWAIEKLKSRV